MFHFNTPWNRQKTKGFLTVSGGIEMKHRTNGLMTNLCWKNFILLQLTLYFYEWSNQLKNPLCSQLPLQCCRHIHRYAATISATSYRIFTSLKPQLWIHNYDVTIVNKLNQSLFKKTNRGFLITCNKHTKSKSWKISADFEKGISRLRDFTWGFS